MTTTYEPKTTAATAEEVRQAYETLKKLSDAKVLLTFNTDAVNSDLYFIVLNGLLTIESNTRNAEIDALNARLLDLRKTASDNLYNMKRTWDNPRVRDTFGQVVIEAEKNATKVEEQLRQLKSI